MKKETLEEAAELYVHGRIYLNEPEKQQEIKNHIVEQ